MNRLAEFFKEYKWTVLCALFGLVFTILIFTINFWRTLLLLFIVGVAVCIGLALDKKSVFTNFFDRKD